MESKFGGESECIAVEVGGWDERGNWGSIMCVASASGATLASVCFLRLWDVAAAVAFVVVVRRSSTQSWGR